MPETCVYCGSLNPTVQRFDQICNGRKICGKCSNEVGDRPT